MTELQKQLKEISNLTTTIKGTDDYSDDWVLTDYANAVAKLADAAKVEAVEVDLTVRDLAMLISRMCNGENIQKKAMDYLCRKNLQGNILREQSPKGEIE